MTRHTLVLLRHGKSDWSGGEPDHERPLAPRGRRQAAEAGRWLATYPDPIDLAVVSTAERARSTWSLASAELADPPPLLLDARAYGASASTLLEIVRDLADDLGTVVLVGHNPGIEDLLESLTGAWVPMRTSTLAVLAVSGAWADLEPSAVELTTSGRPPH